MLPTQRFFTPYDTDDRLIVAIIRRDLITARYILESHRYRSTINKTVYFGSCRADLSQPFTLLAAACHFGSYEIVEILINYFHANVNKQHFPSWKTPLHYAVLAKSNRSDIVQLLLQHGANVDAQDRHGTTPLMLAVLHSSKDIVHLLLTQTGANPRLCNQYRLTAFDFVKYELSIMIDLIRNGALICNINDKNLFHWLIVNKHPRIARLFIEAGYTPPTNVFQQRIRSLKSLCRLRIREQISGSHFRQRVETLPVRHQHLIRYILFDDI